MNKLQKNILPLNLQLFAEDEEEKEQPNSDAEGEDANSGEEDGEEKPTFDDLLADKDYSIINCSKATISTKKRPLLTVVAFICVHQKWLK